MTGQSEEIEDTLNNDEMLSDQGGSLIREALSQVLLTHL
jgi:hypothetical protein